MEEPSATEGKEAGNTEKTPAVEPGENKGETGKETNKETDKGATTTPETDGQAGGTATKTDEEVLKEMEEQNTTASASSQFQNYQWQRDVDWQNRSSHRSVEAACREFRHGKYLSENGAENYWNSVHR